MLPATTVLFAIQAAVRLFNTGKALYTQQISTSIAAFPLIKGPEITVNAMETWLTRSGQPLDPANPQIDLVKSTFSPGFADTHYDRLLTALGKSGADRSSTEDVIIIDAYITLYNKIVEDDDSGSDSGGGVAVLNGSEQLALYRVRQWTKAELDEAPSPIWTVAATLIDLSVDYFANQPGAVSTKTPKGRALRAFLQAVDTNVDFQSASAGAIVGNLMIAALDTAGNHPRLIAGGAAEEKLIKSVASAMSQTLTARQDEIAAMTDLESEQFGDILQSVTRAALKAGADTVLDDPKRWFGTGTAESDLAQRVGRVLADVVLNDVDDDLWSVETLEKVADAAFRAVADHPDLIAPGDNPGLKKLIGDLTDDLAAHEDVISKDALPDILGLVAKHTAGNIEVLWGKNYATGPKHLLVTASKTFLESLENSTQDGKWPPDLTKQDLTITLDAVFKEVVDNKAWLRVDAAQDPLLKMIIDNTFQVLGKYSLSQIQGPTGLTILKSVLQATGKNLILSKQVPNETRPLAALLLDAVLDNIFNNPDATAQWGLVRQSAITLVIDQTFIQAAKILPADVPDAAALQAKLDAAKGILEKLAKGEITIDQFEDAIAQGLGI
jgi:hypothetical protein